MPLEGKEDIVHVGQAKPVDGTAEKDDDYFDSRLEKICFVHYTKEFKNLQDVSAQKMLVVGGCFDDVNKFGLRHFRVRDLLNESVEVAVAHSVGMFVVRVWLRDLYEVQI